MKKEALVILVFAALAIGLYFMFSSTPEEMQVSPSETISEELTPGAKVFEVNARNFTFDPTQLTVKAGDTVRIVFKSEGGFHDFRLDEFDGAATEVLQTGQTQTIEFVADKIGTFEYYCNVGNHRQMGMVGTLTITE